MSEGQSPADRSCDERLNADLARLAELAERDDLVHAIAEAVSAPDGFVCSYCGYDAGEIADALLAAGWDWAGIADTARKKMRMSEPTPSELRSIADWLDVYEDAIEQLILGLHSGPVPLDSALFDIHVCPGNEMQDDLRWWADKLEGRTQPTRDEVARAIANQWANGTNVKFMDRAALVVDALVAAGWLGVSDTPNEGDANE